MIGSGMCLFLVVHRGTLSWPSAEGFGGFSADDPEARPTGPDRFRGRYDDPNTSTLRVTISEGENTLPPIELK